MCNKPRPSVQACFVYHTSVFICAYSITQPIGEESQRPAERLFFFNLQLQLHLWMNTWKINHKESGTFDTCFLNGKYKIAIVKKQTKTPPPQHWLFMDLHIIFNHCFDPLVVCQDKTDCAPSGEKEKQQQKNKGRLCIHTVRADLLKCHPFSSRTDRPPVETSVTTNCASTEQ